MKIKNQPIIETEKEIVLRLHQPFWGAWKHFSWAEKVEGFGVNLEIVKKCINEKKDLKISYPYGTYRLNNHKLNEFVKTFKYIYPVRNGVKLFVFPRTIFKKVEWNKKVYEKKEKERQKSFDKKNNFYYNNYKLF
jgi:hypothetical protein